MFSRVGRPASYSSPMMFRLPIHNQRLGIVGSNIAKLARLIVTADDDQVLWISGFALSR